MTVRYKSATVEEFIEHHSHDVSSGGIFIKTSSPYPPGTLLKFEIRIQDEQTVLSGVGRVVWKREPDAAASDSPAGMGVKFIKIDDKSKSLITRLVSAHGGGPSAYDAGKPVDEPAESEGGAATADSAGAKPAPTRAEIAKRGGTLLGIGAMGAAKPKLDAKPPEPKKEDAGGFFPSTTPESEQPPPEERTVMRQAGELLRQALAEAGGSLDDLGGPLGKDVLASSDKKTETKDAAKPVEAAKPATAAAAAAATKPATTEKEAAKPVDAPAAKPADTAAKPVEVSKADGDAAKIAAEDKPKESARSLALAEQQDDDDEDEDEDEEAVEAKEPPKAAAAKSVVKVDEKPKAAEVKPAAKTAAKPAVAVATAAPKPFGQQQQEEGGGGRLLTILLVVAAVGGALWLFFGQKEPEPTKPAPVTNQTGMVAPPTTPTPPVVTAPTPEMQPTGTLSPTATPTGTAGAAPTTTATAAPTGTAAPTAAPTATAKPTSAPATTPKTTTPKPATPKPKPPSEDPYG
jgi:uncharacterized protein (TIGR02266 family)